MNWVFLVFFLVLNDLLSFIIVLRKIVKFILGLFSFFGISIEVEKINYIDVFSVRISYVLEGMYMFKIRF